jgi:hypothetical protein
LRARRTLRQHATVGATPLFRVPLEDVGGEARLPLRFGQRLAFFEHGDARDVIGALADEIRRLLQNLAALMRRHSAPLRERVLRGIECAIEVFGIRVRQIAERCAGGGADDGLRLAATAGHPLAANEQFQLRVGSRLGNGRVARPLSWIRLHREVSWGVRGFYALAGRAHLLCFSRVSKSSSGVRYRPLKPS